MKTREELEQENAALAIIAEETYRFVPAPDPLDKALSALEGKP